MAQNIPEKPVTRLVCDLGLVTRLIASLKWQYDYYIAQHDDGGGGTTCRIALIHAVRQTNAGDVYDFLAPPESSCSSSTISPVHETLDSVLRPPLQAKKVQLQLIRRWSPSTPFLLAARGSQRSLAYFFLHAPRPLPPATLR
ncbi:hypothetical protein ARSEF1564_003493 [Beauveria bassiana]